MASFSVSKVLDQDLLARNNVEVREKDLIDLDQLSSKKWDYSYPTLVANSNNKTLSESSVIKRFLASYPIFKDVDMSNILIAGGSVTLSALNVATNTDVDLFIYGISLDKVPARIEKLFRELKPRKDEGSVIKNEFATTVMYDNGSKIQVIHRLYNTPSEVLHGFDMGSCSVGILLNEGRVVTTSLGKVSLEYKINILDMNKRSLNYEARLLKYFERGFSLVLPDLDVGKAIIKDPVSGYYISFRLQCFKIIPYRVEGNKIMCNIHLDSRRNKNLSDYECPGFITGWINTYNLFAKKPLIYSSGWEGKDDLIYHLNDNTINFHIERSLFRTHDYEGNFKFGRLSKFLTSDELLSYSNRILSTKSGEELDQIKEEIYQYLTGKADKLLKEYNSNSEFKVTWITVNPASQITGSFHPAVVTKEEFYGKFLKQ